MRPTSCPAMPSLLLALAAFACLLLPARTQAAEIACPATLETQQSVAALPAGLPSGARALEAPLGNGTGWLSGVEVYSGDPAEGASLVPDNPGKNPSVWRLAQDESVSIGCHYANTRMMVFIPVAGHPRQCRVAYKDAKLEEVRSIRCE